jgi:uncharacterized integral membrane protein (TIGR00697 family)
MTLPAAIVIFPISYILADVLTEVYGYRAMRRVIWLGFACNALTVAALALGAALPPAGFWQDQAAYEHILGQTPRILAASLAAYVVGEFANAYIMARLKVATEGRFLWLRTIGSTLVGEGLDSVIFITVAFAGIIPAEALAGAVITQWLVKSATKRWRPRSPTRWWPIWKRREVSGVYDRNLRLNPLSSE